MTGRRQPDQRRIEIALTAISLVRQACEASGSDEAFEVILDGLSRKDLEYTTWMLATLVGMTFRFPAKDLIPEDLETYLNTMVELVVEQAAEREGGERQ